MSTFARRSLVALAVAAAAVAGAGAATAAPGDPSDPGRLLQLSLSATGPWTDNLPDPLFVEADGPHVPGGSLDETFYVFNTPGTKARVSLSCDIWAAPTAGAAQDTPPTEFADALELAYRVNSNSPDDFEDCAEASYFEVDKRQAHQVDVRLAFDADEREAMNQAAAYSITVTLSQAPPKGGKPRVLGVQTLTVSDTDHPTVAAPSTSRAPNAGLANAKAETASVKATNAVATSPMKDGSVTESLPLVAGLLVAGALLAGFGRRRTDSE